MKKKILLIFFAMSMVLTVMSGFSHQAFKDVVAEATDDETSDEYQPPKHEEGKIHVNGYYTVGNDGALMANLEWTYPYTNPLTGIGVDPGRPYKYRMWQSKLTNAGSWTEWDTRSPVDVDKADGQVRVLNVCPTADSKNYLKSWMSTPAEDYDHTSTTVGRGIIQIYPVLIEEYNANPDKILKTNPETGELTTEYQYSVIMFGTADANASKDLTAASQQATLEFSRAGGGLLFGHDTLTNYSGVGVRTYFKRFAEPDFLNIRLDDQGTSYISTYVKVVDTGFLTSRPWDLEGKTLSIPTTHVLGQKIPVGSATRTWMQFSDGSGNVQGTIAGTPNQIIDNYYLITNGSTAMIQTGHSNGNATLDEAKVFANTLIYLAQSTVTTTARDSSFIDEAAPEKAMGVVEAIVPADDLKNYVAHIELSGGKDHGTEYAYKIQAIPQATLEGEQNYGEMWTSTATDPTDPSLLHLTALSGLKGYYVKAVNTNPNKEIADPAQAKANLIPLSGDGATYTTPSLAAGHEYYVHIYAVDYAGNVSEDYVLPINVSGRIATFHSEDGSDHLDKTLLNSNGTVAALPKDPTREGYDFLGWYTKDNTAVDGETVFSEEDYPDGVDLYAHWIEVYDVIVGQRGQGNVTIDSDDGQESPFRKGSQVVISYEADEGYEVAGVWIDDVYQRATENGKLVIENLDQSHFVLVEFAKKEETTSFEKYYSVETSIQGGAGSSITPSQKMLSSDPRTSNYQVTWKPAKGYVVKQIIVDGIVRQDLVDKEGMTFEKVASDHEVEVVFVKEEELHQKNHHIVETRLVGGPGSISPTTRVESSDSYTVEASVSDTKNYEIKSVKVYDSEHQEVIGFNINQALGRAELTDIEEDYVVEVCLGPKNQAGTVTIAEDDLLKVNTSIIGDGKISHSKIVKRGDNYTVSWEAAEGWKVKEVIVDDNRIYYSEKENVAEMMLMRATLEEENYDFNAIGKDHSIQVVLEKVETEPQEGFFAVETKVNGAASAQISAGNKAIEEGSDYTVDWEVGGDYAVQDVLINGVSHPELVQSQQYIIHDIDKNYVVEVIVKRVVNIDTDGDGKPDVNVDTDGDGKPDVNIDTDGDDKPDINIVDKDGDGQPDPIDPDDPKENKIPNVNVDTDGDGKPDVNIDTDGDGQPDINIVDKDGDGKPDPVDPKDPNQDKTPDVNVDTDDDGKPDVNIDTDGDGKPDINIVDKDKDGKPDPIDPKDPDQDKTPDVNIVDKDGDGKPDDLDDLTKEEIKDLTPDVNVDTTGDGKPDLNVDTDGDGQPNLNIDTDGDGKADLNIDTNGDGTPNLNIDTDGDGKADINIDTDGDGIADKNIMGIDTSDHTDVILYVLMMFVSSIALITLGYQKSFRKRLSFK